MIGFAGLYLTLNPFQNKCYLLLDALLVPMRLATLVS